MSAPESEWMLWAQRLRTSIRAEFEAELQAISNRYASLVQATSQLDSTKERIQDLEASNDHTHNANRTLQSRLEQIETDAVYREQKFDNNFEGLQDTTVDNTRQLKHIVGAFEQLKRESRVALDQQQQELEGMRKQIDELHGHAITGGHGRAPSKSFSEATTVDAGLYEITKFPQDDDRPQHLNLKISQGQAPLEEYLASGDGFVRAVTAPSEVQAVKAFVQGMRQSIRRKPVTKALDEKGWTWKNARYELQLIVDEVKLRRRNRRTVDLPQIKR